MIHKSKTTHHPYYTRTEVFEPGLESQKRLFDRYELLSAAKNNIVGQQIFLNHFCSIYSKYQENQRQYLQKLQEKHFSSFFLTFVEIFALRSLMTQFIGQTRMARAIQTDLFRQGSENNKRNFFQNYLNNFVQSKQIKNIIGTFPNFNDYMTKGKAIEKRISQIIASQQLKLAQQAEFKRILKEQFYHEYSSQKSLQRSILYGFNCISNIRMMRRAFKRRVWQEFDYICKHHMPVQIDMLSAQGNMSNTIYLPSYSREINPIFSPLLNHLKNLHHSEPNKFVLAEISKTIVQSCATFHNNTKSFYPRIYIRDVYMDQKKLAPVISYNGLLLDAIGLIKNTKSYQLKLATESTPSFDFQETYLETDISTLLKLYRKYYEPFNHNDLNEDQMANAQKIQKYREQLALLEKIHVGRLINIIYFIMNNRHFSHDYYKGLFSNAVAKPLYFTYYAQYIKECFERMSEGTFSLETIIPLPSQNTVQKLLPKTTLSFQRLTAHFGIIFNDDSLMQSLKSHRFKQQLYQRHQIMKELTVLIFGKSSSSKSAFAFRKMPNPVKYLFLYYTQTYQEIRYLLQFRNQVVKLSRQIKGPNGYEFERMIKAQALTSIKKEVNLDIYKMNIVKEQAKKSKTKRDTYNKLHEYKKRNDPSGQFIKANQHYLHKIEEIKQGFQLLYSLLRLEEDVIMEFQAINSQLNYKVDQIDCAFASKDQIINELVQRVLLFRNGQKTQQSKERLQAVMLQFKQYLDSHITGKIQDLNDLILQATNQFINTQIYENFQKPERLHDYSDHLKDNRPRWLQYCNYYNIRFKALTSVLLSFRPSNSRKYRNVFRSNLLDDKVSFGKQELNSKALGPSDIQLAVRRMQMIIEKCQDELQEKPPPSP